MPDEAHQQRGIAETLEICESEPPVTDLETLSILIQTLKSIGGHEEAQCTLWEKAAKAKSQDRDIQLRWFTYAYEEDNWKSAQKVRTRKTHSLYRWDTLLIRYTSTVGCHESPKEFPTGAEVLLLGHIHQLLDCE